MKKEDLAEGQLCATVSDGVVDIYLTSRKSLDCQTEIPAKKVLIDKDTGTFRLSRLTVDISGENEFYQVSTTLVRS